MSYTRTFSKTISINYSGSVSYPKSESGGTAYYSGTATETVYVNIEVDTDAFDSSVNACNSNINLLTGSVVATEAAQVASIRNNSNKVADTIVQGFFKTIRSDISQQISELHARLEANLAHLRGMARRCNDKKSQMANDYRRLLERYSKLFSDLNRELENRIYTLDETAFKFRSQSDELLGQAYGSDYNAAGTAVNASEESALYARLGAIVTKRDALRSIRHANSFLARQQEMSNLLDSCLLDDPSASLHYAPVLFVETVSVPGSTRASYYSPEIIPDSKARGVLDSNAWSGAISAADYAGIRREYNNRIASEMRGDTAHDSRIMKYMTSLFDLSKTAVAE